jgi:hypothetical protein
MDEEYPKTVTHAHFILKLTKRKQQAMNQATL